MVINFFNYLYLELNKQHKIQQKTTLYNTTYMSIDGGSMIQDGGYGCQLEMTLASKGVVSSN